MFLDPEASKRTSRGPRRLLRDTQRDTQRWSKHWSNSGQIVNPKTSKNKKTKNRLPCLQDIFKKPQNTSKSEIIIKDSSSEVKSKIVEQLWKVLISDKTVDLYESNLMRRICGLIYFPDKESGEIKMRLMKSK